MTLSVFLVAWSDQITFHTWDIIQEEDLRAESHLSTTTLSMQYNTEIIAACLCSEP